MKEVGQRRRQAQGAEAHDIEVTPKFFPIKWKSTSAGRLSAQCGHFQRWRPRYCVESKELVKQHNSTRVRDFFFVFSQGTLSNLKDHLPFLVSSPFCNY